MNENELNIRDIETHRMTCTSVLDSAEKRLEDCYNKKMQDLDIYDIQELLYNLKRLPEIIGEAKAELKSLEGL